MNHHTENVNHVRFFHLTAPSQHSFPHENFRFAIRVTAMSTLQHRATDRSRFGMASPTKFAPCLLLSLKSCALQCVNTIRSAHSGAVVSLLSFSIARAQSLFSQVDSVCFSPSGKYILSAGRDSTCRLWELSTGLRSFFLRKSNCSIVRFARQASCVVQQLPSSEASRQSDFH